MLLKPYEEAVAAGKMPDPPSGANRPLGYDVERVFTETQVYDVANNIYYAPGTPSPIIALIDGYTRNRTRLRLHYGDSETGEDWQDEYDVEGYISTSTGPCRIPILVNNSRSLGGSPILTACIVRVRFSSRKAAKRCGGRYAPDLYRHPTYYVDSVKFRQGIPEDQQSRVWAKHFA